MQFCFFVIEIYTVLQNNRDAAVWGASLTNNFQRLKLITSKNYIRSKRELIGDSKSDLKCRENILILQFLEQFSRSNRNLGHFWKFEKSQSRTTPTYHVSFGSG